MLKDPSGFSLNTLAPAAAAEAARRYRCPALARAPAWLSRPGLYDDVGVYMHPASIFVDAATGAVLGAATDEVSLLPPL